MAFASKDKQKEYDKNGFFPTIGIRLAKNDENAELLDLLRYAANKAGMSIPKYLIQAAREKLNRDGY